MKKVIALGLVCAISALPQAAPTSDVPVTQTATAPTPPRVGVGAEEKRISLADAIAMAVANNLDVAIERTNMDTARQAIRVAQGAFDANFRWLPGLEARNTPVSSVLQGADGKLSEHAATQDFYFKQRLPNTGVQLNVDFENARNSSTNIFNSLNPFYTSRLNVGLSIPLWRDLLTDPYRGEIKIRRKLADSSNAVFEARVINVVARVEQSYWDLVAARQDVQVQSEAVKLAQEQLGQNERQIRAGALAPIELSAAQAELERRRDTYIASVANVTDVENGLKTLLLPDRADSLWGVQFIPVDEKIHDQSADLALPSAVDLALKQRPELRDVKYRQEANEIEQQVNKSQTRPRVDLVANYSNQGLAGTVRPGDNPITASNAGSFTRINELSALAGLPPLPPADFGTMPPVVIGGYGQAASSVFAGRYQSIQAGLQFDLTIRNRTAKAQLAQSALAGKRLQFEQTRQKQTIEAEVRNSLQAIESAKQRITATTASEKAALEKLQSESRLFQTGESTNFLVLTRQNEYLDSRRRTVVAQLDYNKAISRLEQSIGQTLEFHKIKLQ